MTENTGKTAPLPEFTFRRMGGMDQFVLLNDEEWRDLGKLDSKLWMALSCPTKGLEFDAETLALLDQDGDGRIHAQDVRDAVAWVCERTIHPAQLTKSEALVDCDNLRNDTEAGQWLAAAAKIVIEKNGAENQQELPLADIEKSVSEATTYPFNGDGIVPPDSAPPVPENTPVSDNMNEYITIAMTVTGAKKDASGKPGLDESLQAEFEKRLKSALEWRAKLNAANLPLGENTPSAWTLFTSLRSKLDDFFYRCQLIAYAPEALPNLLPDPALQAMAENGTSITAEVLQNLPLQKPNPERKLDLSGGLNPFWAKDLLEFRKIIEPMASKDGPTTLSEKTWNEVTNAFSEYSAILAEKPDYAQAPADATQTDMLGFPTLAMASADDALGRSYVPLNPNDTLASLSDEMIKSLLSEKAKDNFLELVKKDKAAPPLAAFQELRKLALFHAHLYVFLMNFLSFLDFYEPGKKAIFQAGTLYLDGRACVLCVPVADVDNHARLSEQSFLCLIYCECTRKATDGADQNMIIAAALTEGNLVSLIEGRHGLFIDNAGQEWDTKILRVLHNPISLREAVWAPYIRLSNMISEQVHKLIAAKDKAINDATEKVAQAAPQAAVAEAPKPGFDFAKGAGIFAALGVALSAVSATFAYIANSLASLGWLWPFAIILVFICVSGPSVLMAWFKLRRRSLGPLLDASGWAVNKGAPINLLMGATLTLLGKLPPNARRDNNDPYGIITKHTHYGWWFILLLIIAGACWLGGYWLIYGEPVWVSWLRANLGF